ncbi:MAG: GtrA family protein, partial [Clostridia bacterium]|nr:GtrA family protein [Clostridia bacterium]
MKKNELIRTVKYALVAASAGIIQMGTFAIFESVLKTTYWTGYLISLILSVIWNFTLNRRYTFKSAANIPAAMLKVLAYYAVFTPLSTLLGNYLAETVGWNGYVVEIICMLLNFITEFLFQRFVVFRNSIDSNDLAKKK